MAPRPSSDTNAADRPKAAQRSILRPPSREVAWNPNKPKSDDATLTLAAATDLEQERMCREIRICAERQAGQLLKEMAETDERAGRGDRGQMLGRPILEKLKISRDQSSQWERVAAT
jgi:hypothetical protein